MDDPTPARSVTHSAESSSHSSSNTSKPGPKPPLSFTFVPVTRTTREADTAHHADIYINPQWMRGEVLDPALKNKIQKFQHEQKLKQLQEQQLGH